MHSRRLSEDGEKYTLEFGHEGVLFKSSFVMYDHQTNSKWNHSTGLAMKGPLVGQRLDQLPSRMILWEEWKRQHPETTVLLGRQRGGMMGSYRADGYSVDAMGLSIGEGPRSTFFPFSLLRQKEVVNATVNRRPVLVVMDESSRQAMAFSRRVGDRTLDFELYRDDDADTPLMQDRQTETVWHRLSGRALRGPLEGTTLQPHVNVTWLRDRWEDIYPEGTVYEP